MKNRNIKRTELENIFGKISPFEFKNELIKLATYEGKKRARTLLDAGRGNPNWTSPIPREAFFTFGHFAVSETRRTWDEGILAGTPHKDGIYLRLKDYLKNNSSMPGIELIDKIVEYGISEFNFKPDNWVFELADAIIGDNYPFPDRMLTHIEKVVCKYLAQELHYEDMPSNEFKIFAVEGATAAMCYIFDSLKANELIKKGDRIALMTPIFTPYLEIPHLPRYNLDVVNINANEVDENGVRTWQYPKEELEKLKDKSIKALFLVNPSNPASIAISPDCANTLVDIVKNDNPDLMIISDDVYGTFVNGFKSLVADLPYNCIGVYSFSKYFGVTGWRLGVLGIHENNVFDKLIKELPKDLKDSLDVRYGDMSTNPSQIPFIDRIVADSRHVALNHTAGLSTPQQVQMAFFCASALIDTENNYKQLTIDICKRRQKLLFDSLGLQLEDNPYDASYYTEFDLVEWAIQHHGNDFATYLQTNYKPVDILFRLAKESSIVLLSGNGFSGPEWSIRISLANLTDNAYTEIGKVIKSILDDYVANWKKSN